MPFDTFSGGTLGQARGTWNGNFGKLADTTDPANGAALVGFKQAGTGAVARTVDARLKEVVSVKDFGATGDGTTDDTTAIQTAITAAVNGKSYVVFPAGSYRVSSTLQFSNPGIKLVGAESTRPTLGVASSQIRYTGTGACIQLGTDNGHAYDAADYDGAAAYAEFHDLSIVYAGTASTSLTNGQGTYGTGTYGIRDWRGGELVIKNVWIENFAYGFWGIQSDINTWQFVHLLRNHVGVYLGPRSDQNTLDRLYTTYNDMAVQLDRVTGTRLRDCQFVGDGSASTYPVVVGSAYSIGTRKTTFDACWFEHYQGATTIPAYVGIGSGDSVQTQGTKFRDCTCWTNVQGGGSGPYAQYFVEIGNADRVVIDDIEGDTSSLLKILRFVSGSAQVKIESTSQLNTTFTNSGAGTPSVHRWTWGNSAQATITGALAHQGTTVGFYSATPASKPTITGSRGANAALASMLTALANLGLITDSTTV